MKLVKLQDNTSRQLTNLELLMNTVFGSGVVRKFVPGKYYVVGDKVYVEDDRGNIVIRECIVSGVYYDTNGVGWKDFSIASNKRDGVTNYSEFEPGFFEAGDRQILIDDNTGEAIVYECVIPGNYNEITDDGWKVIPFIKDDYRNNTEIINEMITVYTSEHVAGKTYSPNEIVYVVNEETGGIILYKNASSDDTTNNPPDEPWVVVPITDYLTVNVGDIIFATDRDILEMFGGVNMPDFDDDFITSGDCNCNCNCDGSGSGGNDSNDDIAWEDF